MTMKIGALILVLLVVAVGVYYYRSGIKETTAPEGTPVVDPLNSSSTASSSSPAPIAPASPKRSPSLTPTLSYAEAVALFGSRRIQFDTNCTMDPSPITFKSGTSVMLDNRSELARPIFLDGIEYRIPAFGFKILTLKSRILPRTVSVDCGEGKNNGQIILQ